MTTSDQPEDNPALRRERLFLRDTFGAIQDFLYEMKSAGLLTKTERLEISKAHNQIFQDAGINEMSDSFVAIAVCRDALHKMRQKIIDLHPEWTDQINQITRLRGPTP